MASLQCWDVEEPWLDVHCELGEAPFFEEATNSIRFLDIKKRTLHSANLRDGLSSLSSVLLPTRVTVTADIEGVDSAEKILVGSKYGPAILDRRTGHIEVIEEFYQPRNERIRSNDGACGPHGEFWLGTMTDFDLGEFQPEGALFRFKTSGKTEVISDLTIPNQISWSPDLRTMYFTHSKARQVFAMDYDEASGAVGDKRLLYEHLGSGEPDGCRVDINGNLWHAVYGDACVLKINPEGKVIGQINLPTRNITCVQFAGTELIITSASDDDGPAKSKRFGGAVFRVDVGIQGLPPFKYQPAVVP